MTADNRPSTERTDTTPDDPDDAEVTDGIMPDGRCDDPEAAYETPFKLGDVVVDRNDCMDADTELHATDDASPALVVREGRARAIDVFLDGQVSIADVDSNRAYPDTDPLVEVVFVGALDRTVSEWRDRWERHTLAWRIEEFTDEWGVPVKTYEYPMSRLVAAHDVRGIDVDRVLEGIDGE